jgi:hypothetical protein
VEETAFAIGAFCVAAAIIGGGLKAAHIWDMPVVDSIPRQFLLGVFGVILMVWGVVASGSESAGTPGPGPTGATGATGVEVRPTATAVSGPSGGCQVTIANPLATLMEEPDTFSQEIMRIPAGVYAVEAIENVSFGPETQRWFRITVEGRTGFVRDDTFNIERKTGDCP